MDALDKQLKVVTFSTWFQKCENGAAAAGARHFRVNAVAGEQSADLVDLRMADAEREIEFEQRKAVEAVRLDAAQNIGELVERLLLKNLTEEQKQAYQADILSEVKL